MVSSFSLYLFNSYSIYILLTLNFMFDCAAPSRFVRGGGHSVWSALRGAVQDSDLGGLLEEQGKALRCLQLSSDPGTDCPDYFDLRTYCPILNCNLHWLHVIASIIDLKVMAHVFRFGMHYEEMCPNYEEFATLLGIHSERALVVALTRSRFFRTFMRILGLSFDEARELVRDDQVNLAMLIEWYLDPLDFTDIEFQRFRTRALVFCLVSTCVLTSPVGRGGLRVVDLVLQMERGAGITGIALVETILSLDQGCRIDGIWFASLILLQLEPFFEDTLISPLVTMAILGSWSMGAHVVEAGVSRGRTADYEAWWIAKHGDQEREHRATLTWEIGARLKVASKTVLDFTRQADLEDFDDLGTYIRGDADGLSRPSVYADLIIGQVFGFLDFGLNPCFYEGFEI
ncbi:hypothetical protein JCGZ_19158 [Jatropha curcas]|uniref:Aminotransferase-like plant mobile domain-containing protein n=1 Tax=Jatropha curcas TaxID=180498 RepID=A0A067KDA5_JATCU|nr:hypothetical protein JCGZ_19158 [Jatropha curcas]